MAATVTYVESYEDFKNPERGFRGGDGQITGLVNALKTNTITRSYVRLDKFIDKDIDQSFLNEMRSILTQARNMNNGNKALLRFSYNHPSSSDYQNKPESSIDWMIKHVKQVGPIVKEYKDVIIGVEAGFIGAWGEWHASLHGYHNNTEVQKRLVDELMSQLAVEQAVYIRRPALMKNIYGEAIAFSDAFDGSNKARLGHHNDCFLTNANDAGTYGNKKVEEEYLNKQTQQTGTVGETCADVEGPDSRYSCATAKRELDLMNWQSLSLWGGLVIN
jgi:hypothetical protein